MSTVDEDLLISSKTWSKLASSIQKDGFREGFEAGREKSFQKGFDCGFKDGLSTGNSVGLIHFIAKELLKPHYEVSPPDVEYLSKLKDLKPHCIMCPTRPEDGRNFTKEEIAEFSASKFENQTLEEILDQQKMLQLNSIGSIKSKLQEIVSQLTGENADSLRRAVEQIPE